MPPRNRRPLCTPSRHLSLSALMTSSLLPTMGVWPRYLLFSPTGSERVDATGVLASRPNSFRIRTAIANGGRRWTEGT